MNAALLIRASPRVPATSRSLFLIRNPGSSGLDGRQSRCEAATRIPSGQISGPGETDFVWVLTSQKSVGNRAPTPSELVQLASSSFGRVIARHRGRHRWLESIVVGIDVVALFVLRPFTEAAVSCGLLLLCLALTTLRPDPGAPGRARRWLLFVVRGLGGIGALVVLFGQPENVQTVWLSTGIGLIALIVLIEMVSSLGPLLRRQ